ncbi:MAG: branched-chain amino acid transport system permease protein livM [Actinomycetota bacterium]
METVRKTITADNNGAKAGRIAAAVVLFMIVEQLYFHLALIYLIQGIVLGSLYGLLGVALILIYRTNRIVNFAAAAIGAIPAIFALLLDVQGKLPYLATVPIVLIGGPLFGALVDRFVMRRFAKSPRLITTVVTLGVAQGLAAFGFFIPIWLGAKAGQIPYVPTPWENIKITDAHGKPLLTGNEVAAVFTVVVLAIALAAFLRYTRIGIALRASAENADRASLLGIPVKQVGMFAWMIAGLFGAVAIFVQAPLIGVPNDATLGLDTLLYGLAAAMVARMERISVALLAGMGVGVIVFGSITREGDNNLASALMLVLILLALMLQRGAMSRAYDTGVSTWQSVKHFRPIPAELRNVREVVIARSVLYTLTAIIVLGAPFVLRKPDLNQLVVLPIFGIVAVSLVVLTGWAGQISLGQFGLVGIGAAAAGGLVANHNIDFFAAMAIGIGAGVLAAVIIGLPAVRIQGLYLAVTTLAFGFAVQKYILNRNYWIGRHLLPNGLSAHLERPVLYGRFNLDNNRTFYFLCLIFMGFAVLAANAFRRNRSGRVVIAARDNQRGAPAYGINIVRTRLAAFAVSGGIAGMAGVLLAYAQHNVIPGSYDVVGSLLVFLAVVIGGITSIPAAVSGAILTEASVLFGPRLDPLLGSSITAILPLLLTGPLLVLNLYFYPGGSAENFFAYRDRFLRWVAAKHDILVPSLVADRRVEEQTDDDVITQAEQHVESVDTFDVHETAGR